MSKKSRAPVDHPGEQLIDNYERAVILAKDQAWALSGVSDEEIARIRPAFLAEAKAIFDQARAEHRARSPQP